MVSAPSVYAITNSTNNVDKPLYRQIGELIENPYFAPDASCDFDAYQLQCIPGESQECPEGFGNNEDYTCHLIEDCPPEYHSADDDETGQCYPDTEPCYPGQIREPEERWCGNIDCVCEEHNQTLTKTCFEDGIIVMDFPSTSCLTSPDQDNCTAPPANVGCPEGFV